MFCSDKERDFFYSWYFRAQLDENYDSERQFFYFYALFDHLFKSYAQENMKLLQIQGLSFKKDEPEKNKMRYYLYNLFCLDVERVIFKDFNPFKMLNDCKKNQLLNQLGDVPKSVFEKHVLPDYFILEKMFLVIYKLRCDLFHGDVNLSDYNREIYDEANLVLKDFLGRLLEKSFYNDK